MRSLQSPRALDTAGYFDGLPQDIQDLVREMLLETIDQVDGWKPTDELIEELECRSRDGFIPFSCNRGGLTARQFTDLRDLWGSGTRVAHEAAQKEIERQIEYSLQCARESFYEDNIEELNALGIMSADDVSYHDLYDRKRGDLAERFSEVESKSMSDESSSIMFETRFLYHGTDENGLHRASVSCAVNTEGPYHRSHISWAPGVFCEGAKEVEITWRTEAGLKQKLERALKLTSGEVF